MGLNDASSARRHFGEQISAGRERAGTKSDYQDQVSSKLGEIQIPNFHTASCCEGILLENGDFNKEAEVK
jgi:hypothetical protein